jgi:hypothetical protein
LELNRLIPAWMTFFGQDGVVGHDWLIAKRMHNSARKPPSAYQRDVGNHILRVPICRLGLFGLFGPTHQDYLPLVLSSQR